MRNLGTAAAWLGLAFCGMARADDAVPVPPQPQPQSGEDIAQAIKDTSARAEPKADAPVVFTVPTATRLTWAARDEKDGFYRVIRRDKGPLGWIAKTELQIVHEHAHGDHAWEDKKCAASLAECPAHGCAPAESAEAHDSELKRRKPDGDTPHELSFGDLAELQRIADERVGEGPNDLTDAQHAALHDLPVTGGTVSEGDLVRVTGYIAKGGEGLHVNKTGEPVNCNLKQPEDNDIHIPFVARANDSEFQAIVVEMIPQDRPAAWTLGALQGVQEQGTQVRVDGGLVYDKVHFVNADPEHPFKDEPDRMSLWEVHPVTRFVVCHKAHCDPHSDDDWSELDGK